MNSKECEREKRNVCVCVQFSFHKSNPIYIYIAFILNAIFSGMRMRER